MYIGVIFFSLIVISIAINMKSKASKEINDEKAEDKQP